MKATCRALALALMLFPAASFATKVPIPIEGATFNVSFQLQTQFLANEAGSPDGTGPSYDMFIRRSRVLINGDVGPNFSYLVQLDNPNFGKYGNFTGRALIQDAWVGWAPTGITGGTVLYLDAGILLVPVSRHLLQSTTNYVTADNQADTFRFPGSALPNLRDTGIQIRGWALNKKIGFRGGVYEGYAPAAATLGGAPAVLNSTTGAANCAAGTAGSCITPKRNPMVAGFINLNLIGSEEGGWLYGAYKWAKDPVLSVGLAGNYQSLAIRNGLSVSVPPPAGSPPGTRPTTILGSVTDFKLLAADIYLNLPMTEANELVAEGTVYLNGNGSGSANTGLGLAGTIGYRFGAIAPYVAYDYFSATSCDPTNLNQAQIDTCGGVPGTPGVVGSSDSRNLKAGLNFFFNKNLNHVNVEFSVNHGQSAYGPQSITAANAAYAPLALDPTSPAGSRRAINNLLANQAFRSLLVHWNFLF